MNALTVDASVAAKWFLPEEGAGAAAALLDRVARKEVTLVAPALMPVEVANVFRQYTRRGALRAGESVAFLERLLHAPVFYLPLLDLLPHALSLALSLDLTVYDSLYLVAAEATDSTVVTADRRLCRRVQGTAYASAVTLLAPSP